MMIVSLAWTLLPCKDRSLKLNIKNEKVSTTTDYLARELSRSSLYLKSLEAIATKTPKVSSQLALTTEPLTWQTIQFWPLNLSSKTLVRKVTTTAGESLTSQAPPCSSYLRIKCFQTTKIINPTSFQSVFLRLWQISRARCLTTVSLWDLEEQLSCPIQRKQYLMASSMDLTSVKFKADLRLIMRRAVGSVAALTSRP